jgi:CRP-like cAMP-binding protein
MQHYVQMFSEGLFRGLAPDEAEAFVRRCEKKAYYDQTRLFQEMTEATCLYLLLEGEVELKFAMPAQRGEAVLAIRKPGDAIGWSTLVPPYQYTFSGVCKGDVTVLQIDRGTMQEVFATNYHLGYIFMRNVAALSGDRLLRVQDKLAKVLGDEAVTGW